MTEAPTAGKPPLDEVMLAMDVVDTLRHRERVVERALSTAAQDEQLVARLREIYAGQGIEVSDRVIERGVADLRADRFVYTPTAPSFGRSLARVYVSRGRWAKPLAAAVALVAVAVVSYQTLVRGPALAAIAALPEELRQSFTTVVDLAESPVVDDEAGILMNEGQFALGRRDYAAARAAIAGLDELRDVLSLQYEVRVLARAGELSGVWRVPELNPQAQNYYLIVEARDPDGNALRLAIANEEDGRTYRVSRWGQRVDEATFQAVAADKSDDGIIQNAVIGDKRRGRLDPEFRDGVLPGAITDW